MFGGGGGQLQIIVWSLSLNFFAIRNHRYLIREGQRQRRKLILFLALINKLKTGVCKRQFVYCKKNL